MPMTDQTHPAASPPGAANAYPGAPQFPDSHQTQVLFPTGVGPDPNRRAPAADPEVDHWQRRFRRERVKSQVFLASSVLLALLATGLGLATWQLARTNAVVSDLSGLTSGLLGSLSDPAEPPSGQPADPGVDQDASDTLADLGSNLGQLREQLTNPDGSIDSEEVGKLLGQLLGSAVQDGSISGIIPDAAEPTPQG